VRILLIAAAGVVLLILAILVTGSLLPKRHVVSRSASYRAMPERPRSLLTGWFTSGLTTRTCML
jgi:hypothetical protein